jgi:hypothetical protein
LSSSSCRKCQQNPLPWWYYKIPCSELLRAKGCCCPASNAYERGHGGDVNHQRKKAKVTRTEGNTGDTPHLLLKRAGAIYRQLDKPWSKTPQSWCELLSACSRGQTRRGAVWRLLIGRGCTPGLCDDLRPRLARQKISRELQSAPVTICCFLFLLFAICQRFADLGFARARAACSRSRVPVPRPFTRASNVAHFTVTHTRRPFSSFQFVCWVVFESAGVRAGTWFVMKHGPGFF